MNEKILVIDDEESIRFTFQRFLRNAGYEAEIADNYEQGTEKMTSQDFDLVIADIILGGETGVDVLRWIREKDLSCPLVFMTGYPDIENASEAVRLGAFDYLVKPVEKDALLGVAKRAMQRKKNADQEDEYRASLQAVFSNAHDAIVAVDTDLRVIELNEAAERFWGVCRKIIGRSANRLFSGRDRRCLEALGQAIDTGQTVEAYRVEYQHENRPKQVVSITVSPVFHPKHTLSGAFMVLREEPCIAAPEQNLAAGHTRRFPDIIGKSKKMQQVLSLIEDLKDIQTPVLITGETGTGKELIAEAIHFRGKRKDRPLVKVNCSALPEALLESELFGHSRGAFTGAVKAKTGRFELADGGTIFLDEIGDISPATQQRLLRVLQNYEFERVGESHPVKVDVRVIAATNKDLMKKIHEGEFREDLYYRLKVMEIALPPLRERREDTPLLVDHVIRKLNGKLNKKIESLSEDVLRIFDQHSWPGNVRQLEHALEHAFVLCRQNIITSDCLPPEFKLTAPAVSGAACLESRQSEPQRIVHALERSGWNKAMAARHLGMSRRTIYRKITEYCIPLRCTA